MFTNSIRDERVESAMRQRKGVPAGDPRLSDVLGWAVGRFCEVAFFLLFFISLGVLTVVMGLRLDFYSFAPVSGPRPPMASIGTIVEWFWRGLSR